MFSLFFCSTHPWTPFFPALCDDSESLSQTVRGARCPIVSNIQYETSKKIHTAKTTWLLGIIIPIENPVKQTRCLSFLFKAWHTFFHVVVQFKEYFFPHPQKITLGSLDWPWAPLWEVFVPSILWRPTGPNFVGKIEVPRPTDDFCGSWTPEIWYDTSIKHPQNYHSLKGFTWSNFSKPPFSVSMYIQR